MNRNTLVPLALASLLGACGYGSPTVAEVPVPVIEVVADDALEVPEADDPVEEVLFEGPMREVVEVAPVGTTFTLRRGETLAHFARWAEVPVEDIGEASEIDLDLPLDVGTEIVVPVDDPELLARIEVARDAHHVRRAQGYLATRGGSVGTEFYKVRTGDSAWSIARDHAGLPVWLVESFNPSVDLERLRPGQELMLPVVADTVAQVEPE